MATRSSGLVNASPIELWSATDQTISIASGGQRQFFGGAASLKGTAASLANQDAAGPLAGDTRDVWWEVDVTGYEALTIWGHIEATAVDDVGITDVGQTALRVAAVGVPHYVAGHDTFGRPAPLDLDVPNSAVADATFAGYGLSAMSRSDDGYPVESRTINNVGSNIVPSGLLVDTGDVPEVGHRYWRVTVGFSPIFNSSKNSQPPDALYLGGISRIWIASKINCENQTGSGNCTFSGEIYAIPHWRMVDAA